MKNTILYLYVMKCGNRFFIMKMSLTILFYILSIVPMLAQQNADMRNSGGVLSAPVDYVHPLIGSDRCRNFL